MRVTFRDNLGANDAGRLGLDFRLCTSGAECDVPEKAGQWLVKKGIARVLPVAIRAIPEEPAIMAAEVTQPESAPVTEQTDTDETRIMPHMGQIRKRR